MQPIVGLFLSLRHVSIPVMGTWSRNLAIVAAVAVLGLALAASASPTPPRLADARKSAVPVDVELVIAVDVSYSMDPDEQALQREGYVLALTSKEFLQALRQGAHGKIAITYFEWAGQFDQKVIMPWRLIDGPEFRRCRRRRDLACPVPACFANIDFRCAKLCQAAIRRQRV